MLWFCVGAPGRFSEWCDNVLLAAICQQIGDADLAAVSTLDDVVRAAVSAKKPNLVIGARAPGSRLRSLLAETGARFVLALADPRSVIADLVVSRRVQLVGAVRSVAAGYGAMLRYAGLPGALVVQRPAGPEHAAEVAAAIFRHVASDDRISSRNPDHALVTAWEPPPSIDVEAWWQSLGAGEQALIDGALGGYADYLASGSLGTFYWERSLFLLGGAPHDPVPATIDITGRARCLLYGPYMQLPPGGWIITMTLGCSAEVAGTPLVVEVFAGTRLAHTQLQASAAGIFEVTLSFRIEEQGDTADRQIEVRLFMERSAFDGRIAVGTVVVTPQIPVAPQMRQALSDALGISVPS